MVHLRQLGNRRPVRWFNPGWCLVHKACGLKGETAALRDLGDDICEMKSMFVKPGYQGKGIGRALAETLIQEARDIGYKLQTKLYAPHFYQGVRPFTMIFHLNF